MLKNTTMPKALVESVADHFFQFLRASEDIDSYCVLLKAQMKQLVLDVLVFSIERFDQEIVASLPSSWKLHDKPYRRLITCFGELTYRRSLFRDEFNRNRYPVDEILGIPKRARIATDAFLWVAYRVAFVSYRQSAADFFEMSGVKISPMSVCRIVRAQGKLIKADLRKEIPDTQPLSQHELFIEADGMFIALQTPTKRKEALSRFLYEQQRVKKSFELKCGCVYAGKTKQGKRILRGGVALYCSAGSARDFWEGMQNTVGKTYETEDIETIHYGSDGAPWLVSHNLSGLVEVDDQIVHSLDRFHIMKSVRKAFTPGKVRTWMTYLILRGKTAHFDRCATKLIARMEGSPREAATDCKNYIKNNASLIRKNPPSLGTMEATNAYVWAKRMKSFACSWSKTGAEAMGLIRSYVCTGKKLIAPPKDVCFTQGDELKRLKIIEERGREAALVKSKGCGWEPPSAHIALEKAPGVYIPGSFLDIWVR